NYSTAHRSLEADLNRRRVTRAMLWPTGHPGQLLEPRGLNSNWRLRGAASPLFLTSRLGVDCEVGHDPAPPAWKASALPAYATPRSSPNGPDHVLLPRSPLPWAYVVSAARTAIGWIGAACGRSTSPSCAMT